MTHPGCRIRNVTHKASGLTVHRLPDRTDRTRASIMEAVRGCIDGLEEDGRPVAGIALVLWDADGASSAVLRAFPSSTIPSIAMPDFVRNRLLAAKIEEWRTSA